MKSADLKFTYEIEGLTQRSHRQSQGLTSRHEFNTKKSGGFQTTLNSQRQSDQLQFSSNPDCNANLPAPISARQMNFSPQMSGKSRNANLSPSVVNHSQNLSKMTSKFGFNKTQSSITTKDTKNIKKRKRSLLKRISQDEGFRSKFLACLQGNLNSLGPSAALLGAKVPKTPGRSQVFPPPRARVENPPQLYIGSSIGQFSAFEGQSQVVVTAVLLPEEK